MNPTTVAIKSLGGKYGRIGKLGEGLFGWYSIVWDGTDKNDDKYHWTMTKPDDLFGFRPLTNEGWLGLDATQYSTDVAKQFYVKPGDDRGAYESPVVYENNKTVPLVAEVEYGDGQYPSCAFAVEIL